MLKIIEYREGFFVYIIERYSPKFSFSKMSAVNIIPLYIGIAEMFYLKEEIPAKVSINEAIELAKVFAWDSAKKIVNWVLNSILKDIEFLDKEKENYTWWTEMSIFRT